MAYSLWNVEGFSLHIHLQILELESSAVCILNHLELSQSRPTSTDSELSVQNTFLFWFSGNFASSRGLQESRGIPVTPELSLQ
jgi:hypothetical protein